MAEPLTWRALQHIADRLAGVTAANGYTSDLGASEVTLDTGRQPQAGSAMTLVAATDVEIVESTSGRRTTSSRMGVVVEYYAPFESDTPPELLAHRARADIVDVLRADVRNAPDGVRAVSVTGSVIGSPEEAAGLVIAQVTAVVDLTETTAPA